MRCNVCGRLLTAKRWDGKKCACGCKAFFDSTKATIWERLAFRFGIWEEPDLSSIKGYALPLGGHVDQVKAGWEQGATVEAPQAAAKE